MEVHRPQDLTDGDGDGGLFRACVRVSVCVCVKEVAYIFLTDVEPQQNAVDSYPRLRGLQHVYQLPFFLVTWLLSADLCIFFFFKH